MACSVCHGPHIAQSAELAVYAAQVPSFHELPDDLLRLAGKEHEHSPRTYTEGASISRAAPCAAVPRPAARPCPHLLQFRAVFCRSLLCHYVRNPVNLSSRLLCYTALSLLDVPTNAPSPPRPARASAPSPPRPRRHTVGTFCTHQHMARPRRRA